MRSLKVKCRLDPYSNLKETIVDHMGLLGQMSATRDINEAWNQTKKKAAREYPEKFMIDGRKVLHWNDGSVKILDKKISSANFKNSMNWQKKRTAQSTR